MLKLKSKKGKLNRETFSKDIHGSEISLFDVSYAMEYSHVNQCEKS